MKVIRPMDSTVAKFYERGSDLELLRDYIEGNVEGLIMNDKIVIISGEEIICKVKYKGRGNKLRRVDYNKYKGLDLGDDIEQQFFIDDLLDDDVKLITVEGIAGTGKTFISIFGSATLDDKRILYTRDAVDVGKELGFLPGEIGNKFDPYLRGMHDNLLEIEMLTGKRLDKRLETSPVGYLRGASLRDTILIVDEAQNCEMESLKMLASRVGKGSKIVLLGSIKQVDVRALRVNNDFDTFIKKFSNCGDKLYSHNSLTKNRRDELCELIDRVLD